MASHYPALIHTLVRRVDSWPQWVTLSKPWLAISPVRQQDLTPGIKPEEYEQRRQRLMNSLPNNSLVVSVAAPVKLMSNSKPSPPLRT
jgi:hypothetical protein